jgi:hypothetical protein
MKLRHGVAGARATDEQRAAVAHEPDRLADSDGLAHWSMAVLTA